EAAPWTEFAKMPLELRFGRHPGKGLEALVQMKELRNLRQLRAAVRIVRLVQRDREIRAGLVGTSQGAMCHEPDRIVDPPALARRSLRAENDGINRSEINVAMMVLERSDLPTGVPVLFP